MTDFERLEKAADSINKMAVGINPLSDEDLPAAFANIEMSRFLSYVYRVLIREINRQRTAAPTRKERFCLPQERLERFEVSDEPVTISQFIDSLNELAGDGMRPLKTTVVTDWLVSNGFLKTGSGAGVRAERLPTKAGEAIGIKLLERINVKGRVYKVNVYSQTAQRFILDNLPDILRQENPTA